MSTGASLFVSALVFLVLTIIGGVSDASVIIFAFALGAAVLFVYLLHVILMRVLV